MKLFQAVKLCGEIAALNLDESYFSAEEAPVDKDVNLLSVAADFVVEELFATYGYNVKRGQFDVKQGICKMDDLVKVLSVVDIRGNAVAFRYTDGGLYVDNESKVTVAYYALPPHVGWNEEIPLPAGVTAERTVIYGMLANYFLMRGDVDESEVWASRFSDVCAATADKKHAGNTPKRRWL